ncbi:uncharacterized protein [Panulirus ornatus]|uniref:uncharacterized protein n=1 Tax=Panulirus ornatus TaxID=150431 RepID=UPI003A8BBAF4
MRCARFTRPDSHCGGVSMVRWTLFLLLLQLLQHLFAKEAADSCPSHPHPWTRSVGDGIVILECPDPSNEVFPGGDRLLLDECVDGNWTRTGDFNCTAPMNDSRMEPCALDEDVHPPNAIAKENFTLSNGRSSVYGVYYECGEGQTWLSGAPGRFRQCINGSWTPLDDRCSQACLIPRDCADLPELGYNETNWFHVILSGVQAHPCITVQCDFRDPSEDVWTALLRNLNLTDDPPRPFAQYKEGFGDPGPNSKNGHDYFIGLDNLMLLNNNPDGSKRPLVLQFIFTTRGGEVYHATYDNVSIGDAPFYTLETIGNFHGNAGTLSCLTRIRNAFAYGVVNNFTSNDHHWWLQALDTDFKDLLPSMAFITNPQTSWVQLFQHKEIMKVEVFFRRTSYDEEITCPLLNLTDRDWGTEPGTWEWTVPLSRTPGAVMKYSCRGEYMMEGSQAGPRTRELTWTCEAVTGGRPAWNGSFDLHCRINCPKNFELSSDESRCYHFSKDPAEHGITGAARRCGQMGASLAVLVDAKDLQRLEDPYDYLTAHQFRSESTHQLLLPVHRLSPSTPIPYSTSLHLSQQPVSGPAFPPTLLISQGSSLITCRVALHPRSKYKHLRNKHEHMTNKYEYGQDIL